MMKKFYLKKLGILFVLLVVGLSSCTIEQNIARKFKKDPGGVTVMLLFPDFIYKNNLKEEKLNLPDSMNENMKDSILFESSLYLKEINDSLFLKNYYNALSNELKLYGVSVFEESAMDSFLTFVDSAYIFNLAQVGMEEYIYTATADEIIGEEDFYEFSIDLNAIDVNSWYEATRINSEKLIFPVLYASHNIYDDVKGRFKYLPLTDKVRYHYKIDTLKTEQLYKLAEYIGRTYASYIYDYLLNVFVFENMPEGQRPTYYIHYNRWANMFEPAYQDRFIELDN